MSKVLRIRLTKDFWGFGEDHAFQPTAKKLNDIIYPATCIVDNAFFQGT